ncbi:MAG TPA: hypothetical protein VFX12_11640 [Vicinamibacterales bacterium]|nr:hypothetical protein [Vicinamibacterales bacterium]
MHTIARYCTTLPFVILLLVAFAPDAALCAQPLDAEEAPSMFASVSFNTDQEVPSPTNWVRVSLYASFVTLQALDLHSTLRAIDAGAVERNPALKWTNMQPATLIALKATSATGTILLAHRLSKNHPRAATVLMVALNVAGAAVVAHNYHVGR